MALTDSNWKIDSSWSLFLDRDGVINERLFGTYVFSKQDFIFKEGVLEISAELFSRFSHVFIITNQQCIGKGMVAAKAVDELHQWMVSEFRKHGANINKVYVAPEVNNTASTRRKPNPSMGFEAKKHYTDIDFSKSIMVGDTDSDIEFGKRLGMKTALILSEEQCNSFPDIKVSSIEELNRILQ